MKRLSLFLASTLALAGCLSPRMDQNGLKSLVPGWDFRMVAGTGVPKIGETGVFTQASVELPKTMRAVAVTSKYIYAFGERSVERAELKSDGTWGSFAEVSPLVEHPLKLKFSSHPDSSFCEHEGFLYGIADDISEYKARLVRAPINPDGTLGGFSVVGDGIYGFKNLFAKGKYVYVVFDALTASGFNIERIKVGAGGQAEGKVNLSGAAVGDEEVRKSIMGNGNWVVSGSFVYHLGGTNGLGIHTAVHRAALDSEGLMGTLTRVPERELMGARKNAAAFISKGYLYLVGGYANLLGTNVWNIILERAPVNADGSIGSFDLVSGSQVLKEHSKLLGARVGNYYYLLDSYDSTKPDTPVERTSI